MLRNKIGEAHVALEKARNALGGFKVLQASEKAAIQRRLGALRAEVAFVSTREREAQELYRRVRDELEELKIQAGVNGHQAGMYV
jgi:pre-mRNA-splicing factor CDC5/CEF1